jgi:hypothetical protein
MADNRHKPSILFYQLVFALLLAACTIAPAQDDGMPKPSPAIAAEYQKLVALFQAHQFDQVLADSAAVINAAKDAHDLIGDAQVLGLRSAVYRATRRPTEAAAEIAAAAAVLDRAGEHPLAVAAMSAGAITLMQDGLPGGDQLPARALELARQETHQAAGVASALYETAITLCRLKRPDQAKSFLELAVPLQRQSAHPAPLADTLVMLGIIGAEEQHVERVSAVIWVFFWLRPRRAMFSATSVLLILRFFAPREDFSFAARS